MKPLLGLGALILGLGHGLLAQSIVLPANAANAEGSNSNNFPLGYTGSAWPGVRVQCCYDSSNFTSQYVNGPILITGVRWRCNGGVAPAGGRHSSVTVALASAAVDYTAVTTNWNGNVNPDWTIVHDDPVTVSQSAATTPGAWYISVQFPMSPFLYDPSTGDDLVIDVDNPLAGFSGAGSAPHDVAAAGSMSSRVYASTLYPTANGVNQNYGVVVELSYIRPPVEAYLVDSNVDQLFSVDPANGAATLLASTANNGLETPGDLTWRAASGELWTVDIDGGEVGTIDTFDGTFTSVYQTGQSGFQGLAWDETTQRFYLANNDDNIYVLDPATGITTLLGNSGYSLIACLDTDASGDLYGFDYQTGFVVAIDKTTGIGTTLSRTAPGFQGLGIQQGTGTWFGTNSANDSLHTVDPATGANVPVGAHGSGVGLAKGFDLVDKARSYVVDSNLDLYSLDLVTGAATFIAAINTPGIPLGSAYTDLAWRGDTGELWMLCSGMIGTLDVSNGVFRPFWRFPGEGYRALAWDTQAQRFFFFWCILSPGRLYSLDPVSGSSTLLAETGWLGKLDTDPAGHQLTVIDGPSGGEIRHVIPNNGGQFTLSTTISGFGGFAVNQENGKLFAANTLDDSLYEVDPTTGDTRLVGHHGPGVQGVVALELIDFLGTSPAFNETYGTSCGDLSLTGLTRPILGRSWDLGLSVPSNAQAAYLSLGTANPNTPIWPAGAPGCMLYVDGISLSMIPVPVPTPAYSVGLTTNPAFLGLPIHAQGYAIVPGLNIINIGVSNGLRGTIGLF